MRIGQGVDVHAFSGDRDRPLVLGGVRVPEGPGLAGYSDGDVLLHALVDALLGAAGAGDIGARFGIDDPRYAGADSQVFLTDSLDTIERAGWTLINVDCTLVAARPRLAPHRDAIRASVARLSRLDEASISVKATTTDGLGFTGRGEGIACLAVVLLSGGAR